MTPRLGSVRGRVALVTGAASGIGRATARLLTELGASVALADVNRPLLERTAREVRPRAGARVLASPADVTAYGEVERLRDEVEREFGAVDLVVNAAGVAVVGSFFATEPRDWEHVLKANLHGPVLVCRAFLPAMLARRAGGHVVNVASASAFFTPKELVAYGATKHALLGLSQALREELAPSAIGVSVVCPGFVDTPIVEHARFVGPADAEAERRRVRRFLHGRGMRPERVAKAIVRAAERGSGLVTVGADAWILRFLSGVAPEAAPRVVRLVRGVLAGRTGGSRGG